MGLGDNRRSPKMRRKIAQRKLKERIKRRRVRLAEERATAKGAAASRPRRSSSAYGASATRALERQRDAEGRAAPGLGLVADPAAGARRRSS